MKSPNTKSITARLLLIFAFLLSGVLILLTGLPSILKQEKINVSKIEIPGTGVWNGYNDHLIVLECSNNKSTPETIELQIKDKVNQIIGAEDFTIPSRGVSHIILNKYPIKDSYGTLTLRAPSKETIPSIACQTMTYRLDQNQNIQYSTSTIPGNTVKGISYGLYNSMNPDQNIKNPVYNWLTIYNPTDTPFSGSIKVRDQYGVIEKDKEIRVKNIPPGGRHDFSLGHPDGQIVGVYEIHPDNHFIEYGAFLSRYSEISPTNYNFSMHIPASKGTTDSGMIPASTMGPAINWAEISSLHKSSTKITLEIFDKEGKLLSSQKMKIRGFSQHHEFLNKHIGENNLGFFRVTSNLPVIAQSLYYGFDYVDSNKINWAYHVSGGESFYNEVSFPVNTHLGSANWLKIFSGNSNTSLNVVLNVYDGEGRKLKTNSYRNISVKGTTDIPIHEIVGKNFIGKVEIDTENGFETFQAQLLRVFSNNTSHQVSHIQAINAPKNEFFEFYSNGFKELDILVVPENHPLVVHEDGLLGYNINGFFAPLTFVSTDKEANLFYFSLYPYIDLNQYPELIKTTINPKNLVFTIENDLKVTTKPSDSIITRTHYISEPDYMNIIQGFMHNEVLTPRHNKNALPFYFPDITEPHDFKVTTSFSPCSKKHISFFSMCIGRKPLPISSLLEKIGDQNKRQALEHSMIVEIKNRYNNRYIKECGSKKIVYTHYDFELIDVTCGETYSEENQQNDDNEPIKDNDQGEKEEEQDEDINCLFSNNECPDINESPDCEKLKEKCNIEIGTLNRKCQKLKSLHNLMDWCFVTLPGNRECPVNDTECIDDNNQQKETCQDTYENFIKYPNINEALFTCYKNANELKSHCKKKVEDCYKSYLRPLN